MSDKKYVIEGAKLFCSLGSTECLLNPYDDRHVYAENQRMGNCMDYGRSCFVGNFGACRSEHLLKKREEPLNLTSPSLKTSIGFSVCSVEAVQPWQNVKEDVFLGKHEALLEDSYIVCKNGFGIITPVTSGQSGENELETLILNYQALEQAVVAYLQEKGLSEEEIDMVKDDLLESILLQNTYPENEIFWDKKSSELVRDFHETMQRDNPALYNYFAKGIYVDDPSGYGKIDVNNMLGLYRAFVDNTDDPNRLWKYSCPEIAYDQGRYNAYLEAWNLARKQGDNPASTASIFENFLESIQQENYDGHERYATYINTDPLETLEANEKEFYLHITPDLPPEGTERNCYLGSITMRDLQSMRFWDDLSGKALQDLSDGIPTDIFMENLIRDYGRGR